MEWIARIELAFFPWQGNVLTVIRYSQMVDPERIGLPTTQLFRLPLYLLSYRSVWVDLPELNRYLRGHNPPHYHCAKTNIWHRNRDSNPDWRLQRPPYWPLYDSGYISDGAELAAKPHRFMKDGLRPLLFNHPVIGFWEPSTLIWPVTVYVYIPHRPSEIQFIATISLSVTSSIAARPTRLSMLGNVSPLCHLHTAFFVTPSVSSISLTVMFRFLRNSVIRAPVAAIFITGILFIIFTFLIKSRLFFCCIITSFQ